MDRLLMVLIGICILGSILGSFGYLALLVYAMVTR